MSAVKTRRALIALPGQRFGRLRVLSICEHSGKRRVVQCDCGSDPWEIESYSLLNRKRQHCGCVLARNRYSVPKKAHPLIRFIYRQINLQCTTIDEVAKRAGVNPKTIKSWRTEATPHLPNVCAVGQALGFHLVWKESVNE